MLSGACSPNQRIAFDFFTSHGLRDFQAAAIVGNLMVESKLDPLALNPNDVGMPAHGIAQWRGGRWDALLSYAAGLNQDPSSLLLQLDFILHELPVNGGAAFFAANNLEDATVAFQNGFERCGICAQETRVALAQSALVTCPPITPPSSVVAAPRSNAPALFFTLGAAALAAAAGYAVFQERKWGFA